MDIVWNNRKYLNFLGECKDGEIVILKSCPESGPFLITDSENTVGFRLLFNLYECTSVYISPDERVEVLQAELHIL